MSQPMRNFVYQRADIAFADFIEVRRKLVSLWIEETCVSRVRIRATNQLNLDDVMRRDHPRVAGMKLFAESILAQPTVDRVNAIGDDQRRSLVPLCEKVTYWPVHRPRH